MRRRTSRWLRIVAILGTSCGVWLWPVLLPAQTSTVLGPDGKTTIAWSDLDGRVVRVDGLAWGAFSKGLGRHLVLPVGKVYLSGEAGDPEDLNGRLLRVTGVLRKRTLGRAPRGAQGYSRDQDYFSIEMVTVERIEQVEFDQLLPLPGDWIAAGMPAAEAHKLVAANSLQEYGLSLAADPAGAVTHAYQLSPQELVVFDELKGKVRSVSRVRLNAVGKSDDEWIATPACRLSQARQPK